MPVNEMGITYSDKPITVVHVMKVVAYLNLITGIILGVYAWQTMAASRAGTPFGVVISVFCFIWAVVVLMFLLVVARMAEHVEEIKGEKKEAP